MNKQMYYANVNNWKKKQRITHNKVIVNSKCKQRTTPTIMKEETTHDANNN